MVRREWAMAFIVGGCGSPQGEQEADARVEAAMPDSAIAASDGSVAVPGRGAMDASQPDSSGAGSFTLDAAPLDATPPDGTPPDAIPPDVPIDDASTMGPKLHEAVAPDAAPLPKVRLATVDDVAGLLALECTPEVPRWRPGRPAAIENPPRAIETEEPEERPPPVGRCRFSGGWLTDPGDAAEVLANDLSEGQVLVEYRDEHDRIVRIDRRGAGFETSVYVYRLNGSLSRLARYSFDESGACEASEFLRFAESGRMVGKGVRNGTFVQVQLMGIRPNGTHVGFSSDATSPGTHSSKYILADEAGRSLERLSYERDENNGSCWADVESSGEQFECDEQGRVTAYLRYGWTERRSRDPVPCDGESVVTRFEYAPADGAVTARRFECDPNWE